MSFQTEGAPLDLAGLKKLYGEETVFELLQMSVDEARTLLEQLDQACSSKNGKDVAAAAHQLKGLASTMTIEGIASISFEVEQAAKQENWDGVSDNISKLATAFSDFESFVTKVLAGQ